MLKLKLMLTQSLTELELELGMSLGKRKLVEFSTRGGGEGVIQFVE